MLEIDSASGNIAFAFLRVTKLLNAHSHSTYPNNMKTIKVGSKKSIDYRSSNPLINFGTFKNKISFSKWPGFLIVGQIGRHMNDLNDSFWNCLKHFFYPSAQNLCAEYLEVFFVYFIVATIQKQIIKLFNPLLRKHR